MVRIINEVVNTLKAFWFRFASVARGANLSKAHFQVVISITVLQIDSQ